MASETDGEMAAERERFVAISAVLTGYDRAELHGTGCVDDYWHQFNQVVPGRIRREFVADGPKLEAAMAKDPADAERSVRRDYLSNERFGPLARSLIQLWYLGQWVPLPQEWRRAYGSSQHDVSRIVSTRAYKEGLVWEAIGAHPMGAKPQGFGAWASEPPKREG